MVHHGLLDGMQAAIGGADAFDGAHGFAMQLRQKQDAGVQRLCAIGITDHNRTGAAVTFVATFFGAVQSGVFAQPVKQRPCRRGIHLYGFPVQKKRHMHFVNLPPYQIMQRVPDVDAT
jgi:hypothetical protein